MKVDKNTYVAAYTLAPAQIEGLGWVATGTDRSFHKGLFGIGETPELAARNLAGAIRDALRSPAAAKRGWALDRFNRVVLMQAVQYQMDELPEAA
ncbi:hypothetical protein [Krasilnikovia sp. MM14-A1259]|uniref:hypothetical protein n=1 Tax=Krasilnikovia sp. MM14-A1259 TaxID=3373539 RepID=UPI0038172D56